MGFITRFKFLKQVSCINHYKSLENVVLARKYTTILVVKRVAERKTVQSTSIACLYSSDSKKQFINIDKKTETIKDVIETKREQFKDTEQRLRLKGVNFIKDIRQQRENTGQKLREKKEHLVKELLETKAKVKERLEVAVERENVFTIPNILCVTRIAMSPYLGYIILQDNYNLALGLLVFAGITDLLDGWIARTWKGQSSKIGSFLDPLADKVLIATLFISLTWQNLIPLSLTLLIVARDVTLVAAGFVIRYKSLPPPRTLSRYFDATHATAQLEPTLVSKINTFVQLTLVGSTLASPVFGYVDHPALQALCAVTAATTVASAVSYVVSKDTYKFLKKKPS